jgi:hypothetical protein
MVEAAAIAGVSAETLRKFGTGRARPSPAFFTAVALAAALGVPLDGLATACLPVGLAVWSLITRWRLAMLLDDQLVGDGPQRLVDAAALPGVPVGVGAGAGVQLRVGAVRFGLRPPADAIGLEILARGRLNNPLMYCGTCPRRRPFRVPSRHSVARSSM